MKLTNTYALVLGGSSGLGLATAKKLAARGYHLCIVHRDRKSEMVNFNLEIEKLQQNGTIVLTFNKDATKQETISEVINALSKQSIAVLVHSIAKGTVKPLKGMTKEDFAITIQAMGYSWWQWAQALIENERFIQGARNIAFTSEGNSKVWEGYGAVSAAKVTLEALMRQMAVAYASHSITTNCVQAGVTQTKSFNMIPNSEQLAHIAKKRNPFGKLTTPEDVANVVSLLCSEEAAWINGMVLKADGGESLR
ncbi:MAG: SDR family oxidoreductase [Bacteroidetes bacterium]|nr:SDR family oxidoreductase [Bacteroidota bacterium]